MVRRLPHLYTAAADTLIKVALSSCFFNDRRRYWCRDRGFYDAASTLLDVEVACLVYPQTLNLEWLSTTSYYP